ncbi:MAG: hypothetical protein AB7E32_15170 [Desulfovibrio sp.]
MNKRIVLILALLCMVALPASGVSLNPDGDKESAIRLRKVADELRTAHDQLQAMRDEVENVRHVSTVNFQNNAYKVFMKGIVDVYGRVSAPGGWVDAVSLALETVQNLWVDPGLYGSMLREPNSPERARLSGFKADALQTSGRLKRYLGDLGTIMSAPLSRFDDDQQPLRSAKAWWRYPGDGKTDDEIELVTRKLNVVKNLSEKLVGAMDKELASLREQRRTVLEVAATLEEQAPKPVASTGGGDRAYLESLMPGAGEIPMPPSKNAAGEPNKQWTISDGGDPFPHYKAKDKYTGFEELTYSYYTHVSQTTDPQGEYSYDVYVHLYRGTPEAIKKSYEDNRAFIQQMQTAGNLKDYETIVDLKLGERGHVMAAKRGGGMNHSLIFYKGGLMVEVRSSPWAGGLDLGKKAAAVVAAKLR